MKRESFLKGTLILICANAISKMLGAILKIPLTYILGEEGMAIYQTAFSVYIMLLSFITSGLPFAISKYISEELAKNHQGNIRTAMRLSVFCMLILGFSGTLVMFFGADFFAFAMKDPKAPLAIRAIAPAIFFVALGSVYKSCYQGYSNMTPTAISQVLEALFKLIVGYFLASHFSMFALKYTSAAAIFGVTAGEAFATALLILLYIPYHRELKTFLPESRKKEILITLLSVALPMTVTSLISGALSLLETSVIRSGLTAVSFSEDSARQFLLQYAPYTKVFDDLLVTKKFSFDGARWLYGAYSGYAMTVFNLPVGILASFGVSILPVVTRCLTLGSKCRLNEYCSAAFKIIFAIAMPCAAVLAMFAEPILNILFKNTASALLLSSSAPLLIVIALSQLVSSVQYSAGKIAAPFRIGLISTAVKLVLSYILIRIPQINILGVLAASFVASGINLILNIHTAKKELGIDFISIMPTVKIIFSTAVMMVIAYLLYTPLKIIISIELLSFALCMLCAVLAYASLIFALGVIKKEEIIR